MNFFYCFSLLFLIQFSTLSECRPNGEIDIDIETCKCQSYQSCKWSSESIKRINTETQFPGEIQLFKDNICNKETQFVWCCTNSKGQEVIPTADQLRILKCCDKENDKSSPCWKPSGDKGECGKRITLEHLSGGRKAKLGEFPFMVLIGYKGENDAVQYGCGGSLINKWYVLTAGHCVMDNITEVVLGELNVKTDPDCKKNDRSKCAPRKITRKITSKGQIILHENYISGIDILKNDIALIKLNEPVTLYDEDATNSYVMPICLPWSDDNFIKTNWANVESKNATVAGWGSTGRYLEQLENIVYFGVTTPHLQTAKVPFTNEKCRKDYSQYFDPKTHLCAGGEINFKEKRVDTCQGDSGGPMFVRDVSDDPWFQVGIVSFGLVKNCGDGGTFFTKVEPFLPWIESKMNA